MAIVDEGCLADEGDSSLVPTLHEVSNIMLWYRFMAPPQGAQVDKRDDFVIFIQIQPFANYGVESVLAAAPHCSQP